ncbi:MAG: DNA polymerase I [bacterium]
MQKNLKRKRLFIIDASSCIFRSFHAIGNLSNSEGLPTNAVFGFVKILNKIIKNERPEYLVIALDAGKKTFRNERYNEYKAHRPPTPEQLIIQFPYIKEVINAFNIPKLEMPGYEADDIIGTIVGKMQSIPGLQIVIVTKDKDTFQLIGENVVIFSDQKDSICYDLERVKEKWGIEPQQVPDFMGLMGDSSDNIPGVPLIGEKRAKELIQQYKNLDNLFNNLDYVTPPRIKETLRMNKELAYLSKELATIRRDVPLEIEIDGLSLRSPSNELLIPLFRKLEFNSILKEMEVSSSREDEIDFVLIKEDVDLDKMINLVNEVKKISLYIDITTCKDFQDKIDGLAISIPGDKVYYIQIRNLVNEVNLNTNRTIEILRVILEDREIKKIGYDLKTVLINFYNEGITLSGLHFDNQIAAYLLYPNKTNQDFEDVVLDCLGYTPKAIKPQAQLDEQPSFTSPDLTTEIYNKKMAAYQCICERASLNLQLYETFEKDINNKGYNKLYYKLELPLVPILARMELKGILVDIIILKEMSIEFEKELHMLSQQIFLLAGQEFNIDSPKQLSSILFEKLQLPTKKKTKTGYSTDVSVLEKLALVHDLPLKILEYRTLRKLKTTYIDALPLTINPKTGRIHTSFIQTGTSTGRLSSRNPNLQNIPVRSEHGKKIRRAFISEKGSLFLASDYSQIELRILAHLSSDQRLVKAFQEGIDVHNVTACEVFGVEVDQITKELRRRAKVINFGIIYGMSAFGLAQDLKISQREAQRYIDNYFKKYSEVKRFIDETIEKAEKDGYVSTLFNRKRPVPELQSKDKNVHKLGERIAINSPIQGTAADLIKMAMIAIDKKLVDEGYKSKLILQIHDELILECPENELDVITLLVRTEMEGVFKLAVPLKVEISVGKNWGVV